MPTILEYNITCGLSALSFDGIGLFNNTVNTSHSTFCIPVHHPILGADTLRYEVPSAVTRIRMKDSWSDRNNSEWNLVFCSTVSLLCVIHQTSYNICVVRVIPFWPCLLIKWEASKLIFRGQINLEQLYCHFWCACKYSLKLAKSSCYKFTLIGSVEC